MGVRYCRGMGMIEQIRVAAMGKGEDAYTVPPARVLDVAVIGGDAFIDIYDNDDVGKVVGDPVFSVRVPARSLAIALKAAIEDDAQG